MNAEEELVSVAVVREDLELLLMIARNHLMELPADNAPAERLRCAIERVGTASD